MNASAFFDFRQTLPEKDTSFHRENARISQQVPAKKRKIKYE
jgi:hypothetical protein